MPFVNKIMSALNHYAVVLHISVTYAHNNANQTSLLLCLFNIFLFQILGILREKKKYAKNHIEIHLYMLRLLNIIKICLFIVNCA